MKNAGIDSQVQCKLELKNHFEVIKEHFSPKWELSHSCLIPMLNENTTWHQAIHLQYDCVEKCDFYHFSYYCFWNCKQRRVYLKGVMADWQRLARGFSIHKLALFSSISLNLCILLEPNAVLLVSVLQWIIFSFPSHRWSDGIYAHKTPSGPKLLHVNACWGPLG